MTYCLQMLLNSKYKPCVYDYYHGHIAMIPVFRYNPVFDSYQKKKSLYPLKILGYSGFILCQGV